MTYKKVVCRGSYALGTACGRCERCLEQKEQYQTAMRVQKSLDGTAEKDATIARLTAELRLVMDTNFALSQMLADPQARHGGHVSYLFGKPLDEIADIIYTWNTCAPDTTIAEALAVPEVAALVEAAKLMVTGYEGDDDRTIAGYHSLRAALDQIKGAR